MFFSQRSSTELWVSPTVLNRIKLKILLVKSATYTYIHRHKADNLPYLHGLLPYNKRSSVSLYTVRKQWSVQREGNVNVCPMDALTRSDHRSEGGTSKSPAKAHFVRWHTLASWTPLCWCKPEEPPADAVVALHQHRCQWRTVATRKQWLQNWQAIKDQQGKDTIVQLTCYGEAQDRSFIQCCGVESPLFSDWFIVFSTILYRAHYIHI